MRKQLLYSLSLLFMNLTSGQILQEDFETNTHLFQNKIENHVNWAIDEVVFQSGKKAFKNAYTDSNENILELTSSLDLSNTIGPILSFWHIAKTEEDYDKAYLEISTDGGLNYINLNSDYIGENETYANQSYFDQGNYASWDSNDYSSAWKKESYDLSMYKSSDVKIRFRLKSDSSQNNDGWFVDNVLIQDVACPRISSSGAGNITENTVDITWQYLSDTNFEIEYGLLGFNQGEGMVKEVATKQVHLDNLQDSSDYGYYLRAKCSDSENGPWTGPFLFETLCSQKSEIQQGFESTLEGELPNCWTVINHSENNYSDVSVVVGSSYLNAFEGEKMLRFYNAQDLDSYFYAVSPQISNLNESLNTLNFHAKITNSQVVVELGTMANNTDESSFEVIKTLNVTKDYEEQIIDIPATNNSYLAIRMKSKLANQSLFLDGFNWEPLSDCTKIENPILEQVDSDIVYISWQANAQAYSIEYGIAGFTPGQGEFVSTNNTFVELTNLEPKTEYDIYIKSICGEDQSSISKFSFETMCEKMTLPWSQGFETATTNETSTDFPGCIESSSPLVIARTGHYTRNRGPRTGESYVTFQYGSSNWLTLSPIYLENDKEYEFSFWIKTDGEGDWDINVKYGEDKTLESMTTTILSELSVNSMSYIELKTSFIPNTSGTVHIGINVNSGDEPWFLSLDDISLKEMDILSEQTFELAVDNSLIYPNPVEDIVQVKTMKSYDKIEIYDLNGSRVMTSKMTNTLNVSTLQKGVYFLNLISKKGKREVLRLMKK